MADDIGAETLDAQLALQATRVDERPGLADVRCPTLIIAGGDDALCRPERHAEMHALVPGSELVVLERLRAPVAAGAAGRGRGRCSGAGEMCPELAECALSLSKGLRQAQSRHKR